MHLLYLEKKGYAQGACPVHILLLSILSRDCDDKRRIMFCQSGCGDFKQGIFQPLHFVQRKECLRVCRKICSEVRNSQGMFTFTVRLVIGLMRR